MAKFGLSFSGGGVRSAAFCSGVLRRLLQKEVRIDYLSCVSGGGYTGSAYVDWKYRHDKKDDKKWHQNFFNHMRENVGLVCSFQNPCQGIFDCVIFCALALFISVIAPFIIWGSFAHPLAYIIDYLFGRILRGGSRPCPEEVRLNLNTTLNDCLQNRKNADKIYDRVLLFFVPALLAFIFYVLKRCVKRGEGHFNWLSLFSLMMFGILFFPWFLNISLRLVPDFLKGLLLVPMIFFWFLFPRLRDNASLVFVVYLYSFVIHFRVYRINAFGILYDDRIFDQAFAASILLMWVAPLVIAIQQSIVHIYVRWIIQKAFYHPNTIGKCGCSGISWRNLFLFCPALDESRMIQNIPHKKALTLDDLDDLTPTYIGCTTVNRWKRTPSPREPHYELLTMSPHGIERLDRPGDEQGLHGKLMPVDVYLSEVAANSAAAVNYDSGLAQGDEAPFRNFLVMIGLSFGASLVADKRHEKRRHICLQSLPIVIELLRVVPLVFTLVLYAKNDGEKFLVAGLLIHIGVTALITLLGLVPTGAKNPGRLERLARWLTINTLGGHYHRKAMNVINVGPSPPAVLSLSDGGHLENLGILPLLKLRLKKIVAVDGGNTILDQDYAGALLTALDMARKKLGCSFSALDGRDITEDIRDNFIERSPGSQPSSYRFKVYYYEKNVNCDGKTKVGEGEILYIAPRYPGKRVKTSPYVTWEQALRDIDEDLEAGLWGAGPQLSSEEADRLTFCCCECCHGNTCRGLSEAMCGVFPQHSTANQLFTPTQFSAYHREGYRASMEAKVAQFVSDRKEVTCVPETNIV